jgi:hypothetical protein
MTLNAPGSIGATKTADIIAYREVKTRNSENVLCQSTNGYTTVMLNIVLCDTLTYTTLLM